ncbi:hypothetical protein [Patulibacter americanus]|uniref:hypothetical protein n=1 Tax=Patulibacter americanus TaxID=588672 RepID=UPI0003B776B8|nr:hypothetical protein [Patulibacter americanus]
MFARWALPGPASASAATTTLPDGPSPSDDKGEGGGSRPTATSAEPAPGADGASAGTTDAAAAGDQGIAAVEYLAEQLRRDPVYISPSLSRIATPAAIRALRRRVAGMPFTTFVAVTSGFPRDGGAPTVTERTQLLRERVGRKGVYVVVDGSGYGTAVKAYGVGTNGDVGRAWLTASDGVPRSEGDLARIDVVLRHLATGYVPSRSVDAEEEARERLPWLFFWGAAALGLVVPVGVVLSRPAARARRRALRDARREAAAAAGPRLHAPTQTEARGDALDATAALARAIAESSAPSDRALRAYEAASKVLAQPDPPPVDLVGAASLARAGVAWLVDARWRPCFFDPRHGEGDRSTRWRRGAQDVLIPTCAACATAIAAEREPQVLGDGERPYYERDTVWARTGFGALDDEVAEVVLAGPRRRS